MREHRIPAAFLLLALVVPGCGGGGGGGGAPANNLAPLLLAATFFGAAANPVAGDKLQLVLSDAAAIVAGTSVDPGDFTVANGTVVIAAAAVLSTHVVELTLGAGVALTVTTSTITFSASNDAVADSTGKLAEPGTPVPLAKADGDAPAISSVTLSGVNRALNGTGLGGGTLQVASTGFTIDLAYSDGTSAVNQAVNIVTANVSAVVNNTAFLAGQNLIPNLTGTPTSTTASYAVPATVVFPAGNVTLSCFCIDTTGRISAVATFSFLVRTMTADVQPFETAVNAKQLWFLDLSRDVESMSVDLASSQTPVKVTNGANSIPDIEDVLQILGLRITSPIAVGSTNSNAFILEKFKAQLLANLNAFYTGVNVSFTYTAPGTFPAGTQVVGYNQFSFSQMCIAGSATVTGNTGVGGLAIFDPHNTVHENDCLLNFSGDRLGVFLQTVVNGGYLSSAASAFALTFDPFAPKGVGGSTGIPVGTHVDGLDATRLQNASFDARAGQIDTAINDLARVTSVLVAHECGHSLGLVQNGAMPAGLFGNLAQFAGSSSGHIKMPNTVFPPNSLNIMTPAITYVGALNAATKFNSLNLAYLREQAIYNDN